MYVRNLVLPILIYNRYSCCSVQHVSPFCDFDGRREKTIGEKTKEKSEFAMLFTLHFQLDKTHSSANAFLYRLPLLTSYSLPPSALLLVRPERFVVWPTLHSAVCCETAKMARQRLGRIQNQLKEEQRGPEKDKEDDQREKSDLSNLDRRRSLPTISTNSLRCTHWSVFI